MMGITHGVSGMTLWVGTTTILGLSPDVVLLGGVLTMGSSILPDIDHPNSTVSRSLGRLSQGFAWLVSHLAGGHRRGTHSIAGVVILLLIALLTTFAGFGWLWVWLMLLSTLVLVGKEKGLLIGIISGILTLVWYHISDPGYLPVICLVVGTIIHILGDMITYGGCPIFYPNKKRYSAGLFKTNSPPERAVMLGLIITLLVSLAYLFGIL